MLPGARRASSSRAAWPPTVSMAAPSVWPRASRSPATVSGPMRPLIARLPMVDSPKSEGSSHVKFTTSSGRSSSYPAS